MLRISIGIMAYNEAQNISHALDSLLKQKLKHISISEIIVVSSGSTDKTNQIVKQYAKKSPLVKLVIQKQRTGKARAVNMFLTTATQSIVVLMGADIILKTDTLEKLVLPLKDKKVGICGTHPVPINGADTFMGYAAHMLWTLHHLIALHRPKMGEMIAFRKIFERVPDTSSVDEANIEPLIRGQGYRAVYVPDAIIYNKGPTTVEEFVARRRHIYYGHLAAKHDYSYEVSTFSGLTILKILLSNFTLSWKSFFWAPMVVFLEIYSRILGWFDYRFKLRNHTIWEVTPTTKTLYEKN